MLELKGAFGHVVDDQIARHMIERTLDRHASHDIANYNPELDFPVSTLRAKGNYDVVVGATNRGGRFHENHRHLRYRHAGLTGVISKVQTDANHLADRCDRCADARIAADARQSLTIDPPQLLQSLRRQHLTTDIFDQPREVP